MKKTGIFVDVSNIFYCVKNNINNRRVDYLELYEYCEDFGDIQTAIAYGSQIDNDSKTNSFKAFLSRSGYIVKYETIVGKKGDDGQLKYRGDQDVKIAIDMVTIPNLDLVILVSADGDLAPALAHLSSRGVDTMVIGQGISNKLKEAARHWIEIGEDLLETPTNVETN